jgi:hypothetical protein
MRHQQLDNPEVFAIVEPPAPPLHVADQAQPAPAVPDMPEAAGVLLIASYAVLMAAFLATIHGAGAQFAILISAFYLAMFFGVPAVFLGVEADPARRPSMLEFLERGIETATGRISGSAALVQMLIVPVLLAFAILAMGITYLLV